MRQELLDLLTRYLQQTISTTEIQSQLVKMAKGGLRNDLTESEVRLFHEFFAWYLDQYDPTLQPRAGLLGKIKDSWDQIWRSTYRVTEESIRSKAKELLDLLQQRSEKL